MTEPAEPQHKFQVVEELIELIIRSDVKIIANLRLAVDRTFFSNTLKAVASLRNVCVLIWYMSGGTYSLKSILNNRFFEKDFMAIF